MLKLQMFNKLTLSIKLMRLHPSSFCQVNTSYHSVDMLYWQQVRIILFEQPIDILFVFLRCIGYRLNKSDDQYELTWSVYPLECLFAS